MICTQGSFDLFCLLLSLIDTTDVQSVRVAETHRADSVTIQCRFVSGSDAEGCMVVLVGELSNTTVSMTRKGSDRESLIVHTLMLPLSCYHLVFALDIEADGSVGTLPVPGVLERDSNTRVKCSPTKEQPLQGNLFYTLSHAHSFHTH